MGLLRMRSSCFSALLFIAKLHAARVRRDGALRRVEASRLGYSPEEFDLPAHCLAQSSGVVRGNCILRCGLKSLQFGLLICRQLDRSEPRHGERLSRIWCDLEQVGSPDPTGEVVQCTFIGRKLDRAPGARATPIAPCPICARWHLSSSPITPA